MSLKGAEMKLRKNLGVERYHPQHKYFFRVQATDPVLHQLIGDTKDTKRVTRELCQLLHHAHTYNVNRCLLIVGSHNNLMYVVEVLFPSQLLRSYAAVMDTMYEKYFSFLYHATLDEDSFPRQKIETVLAIHNQGKKKGDRVEWHAFHLHFMLWRSLNVTVDPHAIKFPLPPMDMFIPAQNVDWNLAKGPSDTLTKLFDDSEESITIRTPQTVAVARLFSVTATAFHCYIQIVKAKDNIPFYQTINNYRSVTNNQLSFKKSIGHLLTFLGTGLELIWK